jgi:hypothetical protein
LQAQLGSVSTRIDHDGFGGTAPGAHDVAVRSDRTNFIAVDNERHDA